MAGKELCFLSIAELAEQIKKRAVSPVEATQAYLERIETTDGSFGQAGQCSYAEGFIKLSAETHRYFPVTEHALELARSSDHDVIARTSYRIKAD